MRASRCRFWVLLACAVARAAPALEPVPTAGDFAARLSTASAAMEYWDVTAQLRSGHRFFARFLVTNEGPGSRTAAAVGHLVLPGGEIVPIKYGRLREAWSLSEDRRRLKIASAVLDVGAASVIEVDSDKRGIKVRLGFVQEAPVSSVPLPGYAVDVLTPVPVQGTIWLRGMDQPLAVEGSLALTHTWVEQAEAELVSRRTELLARAGEVGIYLADLAPPEGRRRTLLIVRRGAAVVHRSDTPSLTVGGGHTAPGDSDYPVSARWELHDGDAHALVRLRREWLRWDPFDIIPQPFRLLLSLQAQPQRVWADADFELRLPAHPGGAPVTAEGIGVAAVTFARPVDRDQ